MAARRDSGAGTVARGLHVPEIARDKDGVWQRRWRRAFRGWVALFKASLTLVSLEKMAAGNDGGGG